LSASGTRALIAVLPLVLVAGCGKQSPRNEQPTPAATAAPAPRVAIDRSHAGEAAPTVAFAGPDGKPVTLAAFRGKPLLVNLWATWCGPCVREMPTLDRIAGRTRGKLQLVAVNQDSEQAVDPVPAWLAKAKLANLALYRDKGTELGFAYAGGMLPSTILYDAAGKEVWRIDGAFDWEGTDGKAALAAYY